MSVVIKSGSSGDVADVTPSGEIKVALSSGVTADTELPAAAALADAAANPTTPTTGAAELVFNGTTWDRARTVATAAGTTGTGVPAAGILGSDGTNYRPVKTDSTGIVQVAVTNSGGGTPTALGAARATVKTAGTEVQLASNACASVTVKARATNTGTIYVGASSVSSTTGFELAAGESVSVDITNTNAVWVDASASGDGVSYLWVN